MDSNNWRTFIIIVAMSADLNGDYIVVVLDDYQKKKEKNELSSSLVMPSAAQLKDQCILVCRERYRREDDKTLKEFFGQGTDKESFLHAIAGCDPDKFKPLVYYLKRKTTTTDFKNIELLAWLIDFEKRPIKYGERYAISPDKPDKPDTSDIPNRPVTVTRKEPVEDEEEPSPISPVRTFNFRIAYAFLVMMLIFIGIGVYWVHTNGPTPPSPPKGWMRWVGDRFQQVPTSESFGDTMAVSLDSAVLFQFRRITDTCAITRACIGRIWYVKIDGKLIFYNSPGLGFDPVDQQFRLKPLTYYMFSKHVHPCAIR
jgi:hypothetical protein